MKYFGGIEGGATHSMLIVCNENGETVATTTGLGTNHWILGIPECAKRICDMVERAKIEAGIELTTKLDSLGLSLSGCEQEATNRELELELRKTFPNVANSYVVCSDTVGSVSTASSAGGMVLIAGTGSNALLRNPDGTTHGCGGWGHFLGDEGSAWHISHSAMKIVFDDMDNLRKSSYPVDKVWETIQKHFNIKTRLDLLNHCYVKFDKSFFASLCKELVPLAENGDKLTLHLFEESGRNLGRSVHALIPYAQCLGETDFLKIVCVGSVFKSWKLLSKGFIDELNSKNIPFGIQLITLTKSSAHGATYLGVDSIGFKLPRNYNENYKVLYNYVRS